MIDFSRKEKYILHLCADQKFIDHVIEVFEDVYPNKNIYFIELLENQSELKQTQSKHPNIIIGNSDSPQLVELVTNISKFSAVILHNIVNYYKIKVILNSPEGVYFHWMEWGADLYSLPKLSRISLLPETRKYLNKNENLKTKISKFLINNSSHIFNVFYYIKNGENSPLINIRKCFKKIKSVSTIIPDEYDIVRENISPDILYYPFKYSYIEGFDNGQEVIICRGDNFFLGNSSTIENNHLDAFKLIKSFDIGKRCIYCPLSYGGPQFKSYAKDIIAAGHTNFGEKFIPLTDFLPLEEYSNILNLCGNVIMNHVRQQAMGNVVMSLWKGARVFLNEENPIYTFLIRQGIIVYKMTELNKIEELPDFTFLSRHNRPILFKIYRRDQVIRETKELVSSLINI